MCVPFYFKALMLSFTDNIEILIKECINQVKMQSNYEMSSFMLVLGFCSEGVSTNF